MNRSGRVGVLLALLASVWLVGCSRQSGVFASAPPSNSREPLPFDLIPKNTGLSPTDKLTPREIPAGTHLEVRSQTTLTSGSSRAGDEFEALLAQPVERQNETLAPSGSLLKGVVTAVAPASGPGQPGYLRVTLTSIKIGDQAFPLKTSSVFAKGSSRSGREDARFSTRRELRFDLLQPIELPR